MRAIEDHDELAALCGGETLCLWAAQGLDGRGRAWVSEDGRALAVAGTGISLRDRIAVSGPADGVVPLVRDVLRHVGPTYRPLGDPPLVEAIVAGLPGLVIGKAFGWMERAAADAAERPGRDVAQWLSDADMPEAAALLDAASPDSDAKPGVPGVERWAGIRDGAGRLIAVAALAWSAPSVGFLAGVGVHPDARGQGLGRAVCGFVLAEALSRHGGAALMVDEWNQTAVRLYQSIGMRYRPIRAAYVDRPFTT
jgi:ribosomal protein S18 acetylase RimI-like enzyme